MSGPNAAAIAGHRATLRRVDLELMSVAFGVDSGEAAQLVGRARANIRAAEQSLAAAARERVDPPIAAATDVIANVTAAAGEAPLLKGLMRP